MQERGGDGLLPLHVSAQGRQEREVRSREDEGGGTETPTTQVHDTVKTKWSVSPKMKANDAVPNASCDSQLNKAAVGDRTRLPMLAC